MKMICQIKKIVTNLSSVALMLFCLFFVTNCNSNGSHELSSMNIEETISEAKHLSANLNESEDETNTKVTTDSCIIIEHQNPQRSYLEEIVAHVLGMEKDPSIEFMPAEQLQRAFSALVFNEIPGTPPYFVETRRLLQENTEIYLPATESQEVLNCLAETKVPFGVAMPTQEYLPGERVSWRICSSTGKILKEATCCPFPKIIRADSGECLMEAALLAIDSPDNTVYMLLFPSLKEVEYIFTSGNRPLSKGIIPAGKLKCTTFSPAIKDISGGMSKIEILCEGHSYQIELPWGNQLMLGRKSSTTQAF